MKTGMLSLLAFFATFSPVLAQEAQISDLVNVPTASADGMSLLVKHYDVPGGWATPPHRHGGDAVVYVVEGDAVIELDGEPVPLGGGDAMHASSEQTMIMRNADDSARLVFLVHQFGAEDAPYIRMAE